MTTTSIHPGHSVSGILNNNEWGEGYTEAECHRLKTACVSKFEELARAATGDDSISYCAYTSEIIYECWGQTTAAHHCLDPKNTWSNPDVEWRELAQEAGEWVAEHIEEIIGEDE